MKQTTKKFLTSLLSVGCCLFLLQGCGAAPTQKAADVLPITPPEDSAAVMGRFVESDITPLDFNGEKDRILGVFCQEDGTANLFTIYDEAKPIGQIQAGVDYVITHYQSTDAGKTWTKMNVDWFKKLDEIAELHARPFLQKITMDSVGNIFCTVRGSAGISKAVKIGPNGKLEVLRLENPLDSPDNQMLTFAVTTDGNYLSVYGSGDAFLYDKYNGSKLAEYKDVSFFPTAAFSDRLMQMNLSGEVFLWDIQKGIPEKAITLNIAEPTQSGLVSGLDDALYVIANEGIFRIMKDGSLAEQILDGSYYSLGDQTLAIEFSAVSASQSTFYAVLCDQSGVRRVVNFRFDKTAETSEKQTITVFSMNSNEIVKKAIVEYQKQFPNKKVVFKIGTQDGMALTSDDVLKKLNTELLAGKGPDVLVLDDLPVRSYIEKGVLVNLKAHGLFEGCFEKPIHTFTDQSQNTFAVPTRFSCSLMIGKTDLLTSINSMSDFTKVAMSAPTLPENAAMEWGGTDWDQNSLPLGIVNSYIDPVKMFYPVCFPNFISKENQLNDEKISELLSCTKSVYDKYKIVDLKDEQLPPDAGSPNFSFDASTFQFGSSQLCVLPLATFGEIVNALSPLNGEVSPDNSIKLLPGQGGAVYFPKTMVGINQSGKSQEDSFSFLKIMLSEPVQAHDLQESFPINEAAFDSVLQTFYKNDRALEKLDLKTIVTSLDTAVIPDKYLLKELITEVATYYANEETLETAVQNIKQRTKTYLSEQTVF